MNQIAVIPARGGSKRIKKKNIRDFHGKPVIAYAIEVCIKSELFSRIIVSTDDVEIAEVAKKFGAEVFFRIDKNVSTDDAPVIDVVKEIISSNNLEIDSDAICCIFPCTPLLTVDQLIKGYKLLQANTVDFVFPVFNSGLPISRSLFINSEGFIQISDKKLINTPTNLLSNALFDAGQYYWAKTRTWISSESILGGNNMAQIINRLSAVDIDIEEDWQLAEILFIKQSEGE